MTNHFTTPEFADVLKQHGIEIDTIFVHYDKRVWASHLNNYDVYTLIDTDTASMVISSNIKTKPAYLLSQVLGWLPEKIKEKFAGRFAAWDELKLTREMNVYYTGNWDSGSNHGVVGVPIEQLITQGLTEGWLTKEIIEQSIKQNQ